MVILEQKVTYPNTMARIEVESEVTGRIWKIITESGIEVSQGDTILILESMKMEIPVESPCDGTLVEILLSEGDPVIEEQAVAIIETN